MRIGLGLVCFCAFFSIASAAEPSAVDAYLAARDRAFAEICTLKDDGSQERAYNRVTGDLQRLLAAAVPAWKAEGFPDKGRYTIYVPCQTGYGYGILDGWAYKSGDTIVTVTSLALLKRWLLDHHKGDGRAHPPLAVSAAFRSGNFYTEALDTDAAAEIQFIMPVEIPAGTDSATVALAEFTQDLQFDKPPDRILVAVVRGDRVWIAEEMLKQPLAPFTACKTTFERGSNELPFAPTVQESALKHYGAVGRAEQNYLACFARHLRRRPAYAVVQTQAQALVDLLR